MSPIDLLCVLPDDRPVVHRLSRFACRRAPVARVPARCFSLAGERRARSPVGSPVTVRPFRLVADGSVRPGLDPGDVLLLMGYLWRVGPGADGLAQGRRLIQIVLDGIRTGLPGDRQT